MSSSPPVPRFGFQNVVGRSPAIRAAIELARRVSSSRTTVLLTGDTGTGKELFARGIHYAGPASGEPFVAINCAAIPENLLESELFGYERGAFTDARADKRGLFELAGEGTLFLDEVTEMPPPLQAKLLRVLQERRVRRLGAVAETPVRCRIVAASNRDPEGAVERGEFREDLFYRLNVFRIVLPPLRDREDDMLLLAEHCLEGIARQPGMGRKRLSPDAEAAMRRHAWPGNVRELKNVLERAAILAEGPAIRAEHLMIQRRTSHPASGGTPETTIRIPPEGKSLGRVEREAIEATLRLTGGNRSAAARMLEISRPTLLRKLRAYGLDGEEAAEA